LVDSSGLRKVKGNNMDVDALEIAGELDEMILFFRRRRLPVASRGRAAPGRGGNPGIHDFQAALDGCRRAPSPSGRVHRLLELRAKIGRDPAERPLSPVHGNVGGVPYGAPVPRCRVRSHELIP
jgi:hypothetical protein